MPTKKKSAVPQSLSEYKAKRDFTQTSEPAPTATGSHKTPIFVVQEHHASRLHYDFRLEADGVLKSWAVPKEPSLDPAQKRLAVRVEDHPLAYGGFEGTAAGRLEFALHGQRLRGRFALVRMKGKGRGKENWLLIKMKDEAARPEAPRGDGRARTRPAPAAPPKVTAGGPAPE